MVLEITNEEPKPARFADEIRSFELSLDGKKMLLRKDNFNEAIPVASRLVSVEPNNQENMQLLMLSYAGIAKRAYDIGLVRPRSS